jgi:hypothetical protein
MISLPACKLTHVFCDKIHFCLLHPATSLPIYVLYHSHKTQTCRLQLIFVRLHDLLANGFQCFPSIFKIWYLVPNLRAAPHPYLPVMREMRYVSIPVIKEPLADGIVDGLGVFDPWWDGKEDVYLECPISTGVVQYIKTCHIQCKLIFVLSMHYFGAKDLRKPDPACQS